MSLAPATPRAGESSVATPRGWSASAVALMAGLVVLSVLASVLVGSKLLAPWHLADSPILDTRVARTVLAALVGMALALAGVCLQGLTRNPLADPGLLGISAGASFAMVLALSYVGASTLNAFIWFAFGGAAVAAVLVHGVAAIGRGGATPGKLVLVGSAVSAGLASWTSGVLLVDHHTMDVFRFWEVGTVGGRRWDVVETGLPFLVVGALLALAGARTLDTLALGDDLARGLGRRVARDRLVIGLGVVLLAGTATAMAGPIGFVGLIAPHAARATVGGAHTRVLPVAAVYGAVLVMLADTVGRVLLPPTEVQVGIMTAVVGVPAFCSFLKRGARV